MKHSKIIWYFILLVIIISIAGACKKESENPHDHLPDTLVPTVTIDTAMLNNAFLRVQQISNIRSLVVCLNDTIIKEAYFGTGGADEALDVRSVTKSITALLVGIGIDKGFIQSVEQPTGDFLRPIVDTISPEKANIKIRDLLPMSSGFEWEELSSVAGYNNWITADTSGNLYTGDVYGTKIIKVNINTQNWWVFVNGNGINQPNGLFYDKAYNRILVCSYRYHSPIQAISLSDSSVTTLIPTTLTECDGITKDKYGRCYVTSWQTLSIYRFDSAFSNPPVVVYTNNCGPADISYDRTHNLLAIPLQSCNSWDTAPIDPPVGIEEKPADTTTSAVEFNLYYPNPATDHATIEFTLKNKEKVSLSLSDTTGRTQLSLLNEEKKSGIYSIETNLEMLNPGIYFYCLKANSSVITKKITVVK